MEQRIHEMTKIFACCTNAKIKQESGLLEIRSLLLPVLAIYAVGGRHSGKNRAQAAISGTTALTMINLLFATQ
jgi:hypothetical protein